jgi:hypothetical protein
MNATLDVVDLSALMPESRPIAQLYTDSGTAVDRGAGILSGNPALANSCSFATGARRSKISIFLAQFLRAA